MTAEQRAKIEHLHKLLGAVLDGKILQFGCGEKWSKVEDSPRDLANAERAQRREETRSGDGGRQRKTAGRNQGASGVGECGRALGDSARVGEREPHDEARAIARERAREDAGRRSDELADPARPRSGAVSESKGRHADCDSDRAGNRWPARPGERQHDWEAPRTVANPKGQQSRGIRERRIRGDVVPASDGRDKAGGENAQPGLGGAAHGPANRVDRLRLCGNGVVPQTAALAFLTLQARFRKKTTKSSP